MQPLPGGGYKPCQAMVTQWSGAYENVTYEENNGHPLLEDSKATCPIGGKDCISITNHGQVCEVTEQNIRNARQEVLNILFPLMQLEVDDNFLKKRTPDFDIKIEHSGNIFVPLGIPNFYGIRESSAIEFNIYVSGQGIDEWHLEIFHKGMLLYDCYPNEIGVKGVTIPNKNEILEDNYIDRLYKAGTYQVLWDGFDKNNIYDSSIFTSEEGLEVKVTGIADGMEKIYRMPKPLRFEYSEVNWVDVRIYRKNKIIETTLRVNLKDGGAEGIECKTYDVDPDPKIRVEVTECPWDKIPKDVIEKYGEEPIKSRTRSFEDLEKLALEGISYHWGRNQEHTIAKYVEINNEKYQVYVKAINTSIKAMDDVELVFNTNTFWGRSNNPGCVTGFKSFLANVAQYIPYIPLNETIFYNVGYVNNVYKFENHFLFENDWFYIDSTSLYKNNISKVDQEFSYTSAHEIGHNILRAYSEGAGGSADYSYKHKGSSGYSDTIPTTEGGFDYPKCGEIDLMKYYNNAPYFLNYDFERIVAENKDVLGLIWLTKINIR
ncbi:PAAR-like protein, partial [uncultured Capnocytophaga sp.]|uniref:PAAR-like protein n=1 Tax=uncultured Capnocytophaga sp. TaxID=159273 RepID=UPI00261FDB73